MLRGPLDKALYADDYASNSGGAGGHVLPPASVNSGGSQVSAPSSNASTLMFSHPNVGSSFELA